MKKLITALLVTGALIFGGCASTQPQVKTMEQIPSDKKVVLLPALNKDAQVSMVVTTEMEKTLTSKGSTYVNSNAFKLEVSNKKLSGDYINFVNSYLALGIANTDFLSNFDYDYFIVPITVWKRGGGNILTETIKDTDTTATWGTEEVAGNESFLKIITMIIKKDGTVVFQDTNKFKLTGALGSPKIEKMAGPTVSYTINKMPIF